jgi:hypothetical protein
MLWTNIGGGKNLGNKNLAIKNFSHQNSASKILENLTNRVWLFTGVDINPTAKVWLVKLKRPIPSKKYFLVMPNLEPILYLVEFHIISILFPDETTMKEYRDVHAKDPNIDWDSLEEKEVSLAYSRTRMYLVEIPQVIT